MALATIGKNYAGDDAKLEASIAAVWYKLWYQRFRSDYPDIPIVVVQAYGFARASAGVHAGGWCVDFQIWHLNNSQIRALLRHLRAWGASASWERDSRDGMEPHIHSVIESEGADGHSHFQTVAVKNGRNGLVNNARDRYIDLNPSRWRTAREAIAILEDIVAVTREEMALIANLTATEIFSSTMGSAGTAGEVMRRSADHAANGEAAAVAVWGSKMGEAGSAQNLLWRAGVETPNLLRAMNARLDAIEAGLKKVIDKVGA